MNRNVKTLRTEDSMRDVASLLVKFGIRGAPVVDNEGRCVGMLSVSDIARWAADRDEPPTERPRSCAFQEKCRAPGGQETDLCLLAEGVCPVQNLRTGADGRRAIHCSEPHSVLADWQVVEIESQPGKAVRDFMTTALVTVDMDPPVAELARLMLAHRVHGLVVLNPQGHPIGIVSDTDLLTLLAPPVHSADLSQ
jgi:CBS domain-containing protein